MPFGDWIQKRYCGLLHGLELAVTVTCVDAHWGDAGLTLIAAPEQPRKWFCRAAQSSGAPPP